MSIFLWFCFLYMLLVAIFAVFGIIEVVYCDGKDEIEYKIGVVLIKYAIIWFVALPKMAKVVVEHFKE